MKAIRTTYHGATDHKPSRISATTGEAGQRIIISRDSVPSEFDTGIGNGAHGYAARKLCEKMGWTKPLIGGGFPDGSMVWVFENSLDRA